MMTTEQVQAVRMLADAIVGAVSAAGSQGAPAGVLYAALMAHGCSLATFEGMMSALVSAGKLRKSGHLYYVQETH